MKKQKTIFSVAAATLFLLAIMVGAVGANQGYWLYYNPQSGVYHYAPVPTEDSHQKLDAQITANVDSLNRNIASLNDKIDRMRIEMETKEKIGVLSEKTNMIQSNLAAENQMLKLKLELAEKGREAAEKLAQSLASNQGVGAVVSSTLAQATAGLNTLSEKVSLLAQGICPAPKG